MNPNNLSLPMTSTESLLESAWAIPIWLAIVAVVTAIGFVTWIYGSERGSARKPIRILLASIRLVLLLSVMWMLLGWSLLQFKTEKPELVIILDRSASMSTHDVPIQGADSKTAMQSRFEAACEILAKVHDTTRRTLADHYQIRFFTVSELLEPSTSFTADFSVENTIADGTQSRLGDAILRFIERQTGRGTAAIVFLSDGINTAGGSLSEAEKAARLAAIPIYAVSIGKQFAQPDIRLADLLMDREVYLGDQITAEISVIASDIPDSQVTVTLADGSTGIKLDETRLELTSIQNQATARLSFVPDKPGEIKLRFEVSPVNGETELDNNSSEITVAVQDKTLRVLLVQEKPSYEFRFLKHWLERSTQTSESGAASFELQSVLQESDPTYVEQDKSALRLVPSNPQLISQFDVFIFGEFDPSLVSRSSQQQIYEAVTSAGAGCIFLYGSGSPALELQGWPLGELLPIQPPERASSVALPSNQPFRWQLTPLGIAALPMQLGSSPERSQSIWNQLPELTTVCETGQPKIGSQVLANAIGGGFEKPLLVTQFAGAGRVALQASDETYRWTSFGGSDLYYQRYWGQMLRWLSRGKLNQDLQQSRLVVEPKQAKYGQPIRLEVQLGTQIVEANLPDSLQVLIEGDQQNRETLVLSRSSKATRTYQTTATSMAPGTYRALLVQPATDPPASQEFTITTPPGEQANLRANVQGMRSLASQSRGKYYTAEDASGLFDELPRGKPTRLGTLPPIALWNRPWVALLFVLLITAEWLIRRSVRML